MTRKLPSHQESDIFLRISSFWDKPSKNLLKIKNKGKKWNYTEISKLHVMVVNIGESLLNLDYNMYGRDYKDSAVFSVMLLKMLLGFYNDGLLNRSVIADVNLFTDINNKRNQCNVLLKKILSSPRVYDIFDNIWQNRLEELSVLAHKVDQNFRNFNEQSVVKETKESISKWGMEDEILENDAVIQHKISELSSISRRLYTL